ncbi:hypothetical protein [Paenibacillus sp. MER TA 81-3]|nr:hypothetical protein [Paenibacillus sp. MER TA 81-3]
MDSIAPEADIPATTSGIRRDSQSFYERCGFRSMGQGYRRSVKL